MNILKEIIALVRWCCSKPKKGNTVTPTQRQSYALSAAAGVFLITGQPATLTYAQHTTTSYTLQALAGSFLITGHDAGLSGSTHVLGASRGVFSLTGKPAVLRVTRRLRALAGAMVIAS